MASVVKKMECYNIRKSVKDLGEDLNCLLYTSDAADE